MDFIKFKASPKNTGPITIQRRYGKPVALHFKEGEPLAGGDLVAGETYDLDPQTGEIRKVDPPK